jgi:hypothetical protein
VVLVGDKHFFAGCAMIFGFSYQCFQSGHLKARSHLRSKRWWDVGGVGMS